MTGQTFGSALPHPWALVKFGSNQPNGRRPGTTVAYLTDIENATHFLGGLVEHYRARDEPYARWHYRYKKAKLIPKTDVLYIFGHTDKSPHHGPSDADVRRARKTIPKTTEEK